MSIRVTTASVASILLLLSQPLFAQKRPLGLDMASTAERYAEAVGQRFSFVCPASDGGPAYVFGTDVYTDNSPVCKAAIHAGALPPGVAGVVTIAIGSSVPAFRGSARNGVTTSSYRTWPRSYSFVTGGAPGRITWETVWSNVPAGLNTVIALECPSGGTATGGVWGTMVYAGGSAICAAAVHAGAITAARGGSIEIRRSVHSGEFVGSARNGVTSQAWPPQSEAFTVDGAAPEMPLALASGVSPLQISDPVTVRETPAPLVGSSTPSSGPRSINLMPYTSVGTGTQPFDMIINIPLNLTRLRPDIARVRAVCEMHGEGNIGAGGTNEINVVDGQFIGTLAVYARAGATGIPSGTVVRYYCVLGALDAAGGRLPAPDLGRAEFRGDFTW
jgi:hypothetical protein